jgi:hypothetical protein
MLNGVRDAGMLLVSLPGLWMGKELKLGEEGIFLFFRKDFQLIELLRARFVIALIVSHIHSLVAESLLSTSIGVWSFGDVFQDEETSPSLFE